MQKIPDFTTEEQERDYWEQHSPLEHLNELTEVDIIDIDQPPTKIPITLRIRPDLKSGIEKLAQARGIPYQTLIHSWLMERYYDEIRPAPTVSTTDLESTLEGVVDRAVERAFKRQRARRRPSQGPGPASAGG